MRLTCEGIAIEECAGDCLRRRHGHGRTEERIPDSHVDWLLERAVPTKIDNSVGAAFHGGAAFHRGSCDEGGEDQFVSVRLGIYDLNSNADNDS